MWTYNPGGLRVDQLPVIYGYNAGPPGGPCFRAVALAEDGTVLWTHGCTDEGYMPADLNLLGPFGQYEAHYPGGYRCEFVPSSTEHAGLQAAVAKSLPAGGADGSGPCPGCKRSNAIIRRVSPDGAVSVARCRWCGFEREPSHEPAARPTPTEAP